MTLKSTPQLYSASLGLLTDLYQLTMAYGYWKNNLHLKETVFHHFFRRSPFGGGYTIAAGLAYVIDFLEKYRFSSDDLAYLESLKGADNQPLFSKEFLDYLATLKFTCDVDAMPEGTVAFPFEPLLRIQGPLIQCQMLESPILNLMNFSTLIATKAARVCFSAQNDPVMEFGLRRAQGIDGAITASRAAFIGGCESTSNVLAGKLLDIPVRGTHSHSWVMLFDTELESFQKYAEALPNNCIFLVDTYSTIQGVKRAIEVGKWLKKQGKTLLGIRLDSGDLADLSIRSRKLLDEAGFKETKIVASSDLDEILISELKRQGAQIAVWGVGTSLVTGKDQAALDGVYKLSAVKEGKEWKYKLKLSEQMSKISNPGIQQVRRYYSSTGESTEDLIYNVNQPLTESSLGVNITDSTFESPVQADLSYRDLLVPIFRNGKKVYEEPSLVDIRQNTKNELAQFPIGIKRFFNPHLYPVQMEKNLYTVKIELIRQIRNKKI